MHVSNVSPDKIGNEIIPHSNLNQFGEQRDNFVFATESKTERDFYALRVNDTAGHNINWKKTAKIDGQIKPVFIMDKINHESYTYFVPKSLFLPVVESYFFVASSVQWMRANFAWALAMFMVF